MKQFTLISIMQLLTVVALAQWTDQNSGISNDFNDVYFTDDNTGWIVGRQGKILHTSDGGSNWELQNSGTSEDLNKIHMVNSGAGYAVGDNGTFVKYDGATWSSIDINYSQDMHGVYFVSANTGWISGDWGRIMKTSDGGSSWSTEMDNSTFTNLFYDLHMISQTEGWAVGTSGKVLKYNGTSWSGQNTPASDDLFAVHFNNSGNGFMVGDQSKVYHYNGSSWTEHSTTLSSSSYDVEDVYVLSDNEAYAATAVSGGGGIILKYDGTSWKTDYENTDFLKSELFYGICFPSASKGYAVGPGGLIKTAGSATSIIEDTKNSLLKVYPNPTTGELFLGNTDGEVTIYNSMGKCIYETVAVGNKAHVVDLSNVEKGVYWLRVNNDGEAPQTHQVVVQ